MDLQGIAIFYRLAMRCISHYLEKYVDESYYVQLSIHLMIYLRRL